MNRTLLTRIGNLEQYDALKKTVIWIDPKESRWAKVYGQLEIDDHVIFITTGKSMADKLLIGNITNINKRSTIKRTENVKPVFKISFY